MENDKRAISKWGKSDISYLNFREYIEHKPNKFKLTIIDLFYISNFKGGNSTINEKETEIELKLKSYEDILKEIDIAFSSKKLYQTTEKELTKLIDFSNRVIEFSVSKGVNKIDGFSVSYISTLLHFYFPDLYPILDRRVLNGLKLITEKDIDKLGQVRNIHEYYPTLITKFRELNNNKSIRELDKEYFIKEFKLKSNNKTK